MHVNNVDVCLCLQAVMLSHTNHETWPHKVLSL